MSMSITQPIKDLLSSQFQPYNISEQVKLYDIFPLLKPSCIKEAITDVVEVCTGYGPESLDPSIRAKAAVKLSLCEFEAVGLSIIPQGCYSNSIEEMMDCMLEIEHSSHWWTTYSGNYQRLSDVCSTYREYYQEKAIIETFLNITDFMADFHNQFKSSVVSETQEFQSNMKDEFAGVYNQFTHFESLLSQMIQKHSGIINDSIVAIKNKLSTEFVDELQMLKNDRYILINQILESDTEIKNTIDSMLVELTEDMKNQISAKSEFLINYMNITRLNESTALHDIIEENLQERFKDIAIFLDKFTVDIQTETNKVLLEVNEKLPTLEQQYLGNFAQALSNIDKQVLSASLQWQYDYDVVFANLYAALDLLNSNLNSSVKKIEQIEHVIDTIIVDTSFLNDQLANLILIPSTILRAFSFIGVKRVIIAIIVLYFKSTLLCLVHYGQSFRIAALLMSATAGIFCSKLLMSYIYN